MPHSANIDFSDFAPGEAILHLGGQYHFAQPITSGERVNLIVWLFGKHGVVRVAPQDESDLLKPHQRWGAAAAERSASAVTAWRAASAEADACEATDLLDEDRLL